MIVPLQLGSDKFCFNRTTKIRTDFVQIPNRRLQTVKYLPGWSHFCWNMEGQGKDQYRKGMDTGVGNPRFSPRAGAQLGLKRWQGSSCNELILPYTILGWSHVGFQKVGKVRTRAVAAPAYDPGWLAGKGMVDDSDLQSWWWQRAAQRQLVRGHLQCPVPLAGTRCRPRCGSVTSAWRSRKNWFCSTPCWIDNSIDD